MTDWTAGVWSPTDADEFSSSLCVQTGSGAHPASCTMGTGGSFPGGKARPGRDADHSTPSSVEVKKEQKLYLLSPRTPPWRVIGPLYLFYLKFLNQVTSQYRAQNTVVWSIPCTGVSHRQMFENCTGIAARLCVQENNHRTKPRTPRTDGHRQTDWLLSNYFPASCMGRVTAEGPPTLQLCAETVLTAHPTLRGTAYKCQAQLSI
jgi:hypothetical protein